MACAQQDAEALVEEGLRVTEIPIRQPFFEFVVVLAILNARLFAQREFLSVEIRRIIVGDDAALSVKRALGFHIDRAGGLIGIVLGTGGAINFHRLHASDRKTFEASGARRRTATAIRIGARGAHPIHGDAGVLHVHAAQTRAAGLGLHVFKVDPGEIFQKFADIAVHHLAENIGGNRGNDVHVLTLRGDRLRITFPRIGHGEGLHDLNAILALRHLSRGRTRQIDLAHGGLPRRDRERLFDRRIAGVIHHQIGGAGRDADQLERSVLLGERRLVGALEAHLGVVDVFLGGRIKHPTLNGAGAGLSVEDPSGEEPAQDEG